MKDQPHSSSEPHNLRAQLTEAISRVEGWLYLDEALALLEATVSFRPKEEVLNVVEIGSWKGRSTIALALGLKVRGSGKVYAIDPHQGVSNHAEVLGTGDTFESFINNVVSAGVAKFVEPIRSTSHSARAGFRDRSVHLLFVDGSHKYEDVVQDIEDWEGALRDDAIAAFNDPSLPGVYRALKRNVLGTRTPFRSPRLVQNTLFFRFQRFARWTSADALRLSRLRLVLALRFQANHFRRFMPMWLVRLGHRLSRSMVGG